MTPAPWPRREPLDERLLVIDAAAGGHVDAHVRDLGRFLRAGDLLVTNDAATLPASLAATVEGGAQVEVRLLAESERGTWSAVLFGPGDWRTRTEHRPLPPVLAPGASIRFDDDLEARVEHVSPISPRLVEIRFREHAAAFWSALYAHGRPVQYAHVAGPLALWHVQTRYGARPWASELASAGRPLAWDLLLELRRGGVELAALTHAAGLSATGDPALDAALPLGERYDIPAATVDAVGAARSRGGRVVAVGTTVVRALEGAARNHGALVAGEGTTELRLDRGARLRVVDGLFTGLHDASASHYRLLEAFAPEGVLARAYEHADRAGYLNHEFGDSSLIVRAA